MHKIRLNLHSNIKMVLTEDRFPFQEKEVVEFVNAFSEDTEYDPPTLKDISTIMYAMVGQGVTWQLAHELSKRSNSDICKNPYELSELLMEIFEEYYNMPDEEADKKYEEYPKLYRPSSPATTDYDE